MFQTESGFWGERKSGLMLDWAGDTKGDGSKKVKNPGDSKRFQVHQGGTNQTSKR